MPLRTLEIHTWRRSVADRSSVPKLSRPLGVPSSAITIAFADDPKARARAVELILHRERAVVCMPLGQAIPLRDRLSSIAEELSKDRRSVQKMFRVDRQRPA